VQGAIRCSRCDSRRDSYYRECEYSPPPPTLCPEKPNFKYCLIMRQTDSQGNQLLFSRDCQEYYYEERCVVENITATRSKTICFRTCNEDGCNSQVLKQRSTSSKLRAPSKITCFIVTLLLMVMNVMMMETTVKVPSLFNILCLIPIVLCAVAYTEWSTIDKFQQ
ncbi:uncharacterized protein LOC115212746, partial [Argonauta hians]